MLHEFVEWRSPLFSWLSNKFSANLAPHHVAYTYVCTHVEKGGRRRKGRRKSLHFLPVCLFPSTPPNHVEISVPPAEYFWMEAIATRARGDAENAVQVPCSLIYFRFPPLSRQTRPNFSPRLSIAIQPCQDDASPSCEIWNISFFFFGNFNLRRRIPPKKLQRRKIRERKEEEIGILSMS